MKIMLLGANGMAGHMIAAYLRRHGGYEVIATARDPSGESSGPSPAAAEGTVRRLDVRRLPEVAALVREVKPDVIVNAVGVLNRQAEDWPLDAYIVNGMLPHWLAYLCEREGSRLIHISSDCVFLGDRGDYREDDPPDGITVYARSKALGEIRDPRHLTIRTSIIGPEIRPRGIGLMKWFLDSRGRVRGFVNVKWNGVTTLELAKAVHWAIGHPEAGGLVHLTAPEPISKHDLLLLMQRVFDKNDVVVAPDPEPAIDRTLAVTRGGFGHRPPDYRVMLEELRDWMSGGWA